MSSSRYCELHEPHPSHEWYSTGDIDSYGFGDYFYCEGVLDVPAVWVAVRRRNVARENLLIQEQRLADVCHNYRRPESE